jgi:hypothetical protein
MPLPDVVQVDAGQSVSAEIDSALDLATDPMD